MYRILPATPSDDAELRALCSIPIRGDISLAFERSPSFFAAAGVQCNEPEIYICRERNNEAVLGMFGVGKRMVWLDGKPSEVRYFSDLRIAPNASGSRLFFEMCKFVKSQGIVKERLAQTIIFADNAPMLEMVGQSEERSRRLQLPFYHRVGRYVSHLLPFSNRSTKQDTRWDIRHATAADIPIMQQFHDQHAPNRPFFPVMHFDRIGKDPFYFDLNINDFWLAFSGERLVGMVAVWDQKTFKQTRVVSYSMPIRLARPLANWLSPLLGNIPLPPAGGIMSYLSLSAILIEQSDRAVFHALLVSILRFYKGSGAAYLLAGGLETDPLMQVYRDFPRKRTIYGEYFWVNEAEHLPTAYRHPGQYFDVARI